MLEKHETQPIDVQDDDLWFIAARKQKRKIIKPTWYANYLSVDSSNPIAYLLAVGENINSDKPPSYKEAVKSKEAIEWLISMNEEMQSFSKNKTWELVPLPKVVKLVGCKWVFKKKEGLPGVEYTRFKAWFYGTGFS